MIGEYKWGSTFPLVGPSQHHCFIYINICFCIFSSGYDALNNNRLINQNEIQNKPGCTSGCFSNPKDKNRTVVRPFALFDFREDLHKLRIKFNKINWTDEWHGINKWLVLCILCSLDCSFLIAPSVSSNVYFKIRLASYITYNMCTSSALHVVLLTHPATVSIFLQL